MTIFAPRFWLGALVCIFFGVMATLLIRREAGLDHGVSELGVSPDFLTATWIEHDQFMWIERGGVRIGAYSLSLGQRDDFETYDLEARTRLAFPMFNRPAKLSMDIQVEMNSRFEMEVFRGRMSALGAEVLADAFIEDLQVFYRLAGPEMLIAGGGAASRFTIERPVMLSDAIRPVVMQAGRLRVGKKWQTMASDPLQGRFEMTVSVEVEALETIEINGEEIEAFRVSETAGEIRTVTWYDADGKALKTDLGNGLVMIAADRNEVYERYPSLKRALVFPDLDRDQLRLEAIQSGATDVKTALPWLPEL